jgi:histidinol-phosphate/aromatic aminotransferase/cobyric acid decarboxylase-like protein
VKRLLNESWILAKDCSGKRGFGEGQFVRLAVRNEADNEALLGALQHIEASSLQPA